MVQIWTDGSCHNRTKMNGGAGIVLKYGKYEKYISLGQYINTTSARCEIRAVLESLRLILNKDLSITLYCDNQYVVKSVMMGWAERWESEGFINRVNADLWKEVLFEIRKFKPNAVELVWIRGHNGNFYNELADELAGIGAKSENLINDSVK